MSYNCYDPLAMKAADIVFMEYWPITVAQNDVKIV